jgi:hypothetical protein
MSGGQLQMFQEKIRLFNYGDIIKCVEVIADVAFADNT